MHTVKLNSKMISTLSLPSIFVLISGSLLSSTICLYTVLQFQKKRPYYKSASGRILKSSTFYFKIIYFAK